MLYEITYTERDPEEETDREIQAKQDDRKPLQSVSKSCVLWNANPRCDYLLIILQVI